MSADIIQFRLSAKSQAGNKPVAPFYGAQCSSYPACIGGCGLGCTKEVQNTQAEINASARANGASLYEKTPREARREARQLIPPATETQKPAPAA
jgi:hypothetical protein